MASNEMIGLGQNGLLYLWQKMKDTFVMKQSGKGLSTNDYTNEEKAKLSAFSTADKYALKSELASVYRYKGSVATYDALPTSGLTAGDVYNVEADGMNYGWTGSAWDSLGSSFSFRELTNSEIDAILDT